VPHVSSSHDGEEITRLQHPGTLSMRNGAALDDVVMQRAIYLPRKYRDQQSRYIQI
jgi:hypothetical protein